ncbi:MAG: hypothetical protein GY803_30530 [Chloroflexi bacterium]|nr:hypothetical protein [Chloroflexota bacterium]
MSHIDLEKVEQDARRVFNQDGLIYIFMGLLLAMVGWSFSDTRFSGLGGLAALLIFPIEIVRRKVTYPRVGYAKFTPPGGLARGIIGFAVVAVAALIVVAFAGDGMFQKYMPMAISIVFALSFYFGASMTGLRWYSIVIIALILVGGWTATVLFEDWHWGTAVLFWFIAAILIPMGIVKLICFLRDYPLPTGEMLAHDDGR